MRGLPLHCTVPKFKCGGAAPIKLRRRAYQRYQKLDVADEAAREPAYTVTKKAKEFYEMGATQKQFNVGDDVRPATKVQSKWRKLYQIVAAKGVVATVGDPETR